MSEPKASATQVGGNHYKDLAVQPAEYCQRNRLGFCESSVVKYVTRHRSKNGAEDVRKAIHFLQLLLEIEYGQGEQPPGKSDKSVAEHPSDTTRCVKCGFYFSFPSNETPPPICTACSGSLSKTSCLQCGSGIDYRPGDINPKMCGVCSKLNAMPIG